MVAQPGVLHPLPYGSGTYRQTGHAVDDVHDQPVAVQVVADHHVERRGGRTDLLVAAHVQVGVAGPAVGQAVDEPRVTVVGEDHRLVGGEQGVMLRVGHAMRVLLGGQQPRQVDDVDDSHGQLRQVAAQQLGGGQDLLGRDVARSGQHHVRLPVAVLVARPVPDAGAAGAVHLGLFHGQPVEAGLLAGHDDVDVVPAAQGVVGHGQQGVGVRRQIDPDHFRALVEDVVDETGVLVGEAVVVLAPHVRGQQVVEGGDRGAPGQAPRGAQPLDVLVGHRVDDVHERLVAGEQPVPAGQQVALQPALAGVFGQDLHHPAMGVEVFVDLEPLGLPCLAAGLVDGLEPVGGGLVGADEPEVAPVRGAPHDVLQQVAEDTGGLVQGGTRLVDLDRVLLQRRQGQFPQQQTAVGVRGRAQAPGALRDAGQHLLARTAVLVEQFLGPVRAQPVLELAQVVGVVPDGGQRHLMGTPGALHRHPVDLGRPGPALRGAQHDQRPARALGRAVLPRGALELGDPVQSAVHSLGHGAVHGHRVVAGDVDRVVAVAAQQLVEFAFRQPGQHRRVGDLVAVQVQDRQDGTVVDGVEELVGVPGRGQRPGLRLAVTDDAGDHQVRAVEGGSVGVREGVAQFAALVDGAGRLGRHMARHAAGEGKLPEQPGHAVGVPGDVRVGLAVRAFQPRVGEHGGPTVARAPDAQGVQVTGLDDTVEMRVHQVQARGGAPVPEQPRFDVLRAQRLGQQGIGHQVDLADGQVVRGAPVGVQRPQFLLGEPGGRLLRVDGHGRSLPGQGVDRRYKPVRAFHHR
ncbi:hypothetical protein SNL152K_1354 [Streptomyces sp. NL15-2K]|nr:hypothetical protein SNL152K_1354 [Streptomyces sp. NL15-2K]